MDIAEQKKEIRRQIKAQKAELDAQRKQAMSRQIAEAVERMPEFAGAQTIIAYWALPDEVDLNDAIVRWASSRAVYLPVMVGRSLEFRQFTEVAGLNSDNGFGVGEPTGGRLLPTGCHVDLMLVPGIAFTAGGARLGRGRGFYDRIMQRFASTFKCGIAFPFQIVGSLPCEPHDMTVDRVVCQ